jgi:hypothetical protein
MGVKVEIEGAEQLRELAAKLTGADAQIRAELRKSFSTAAKPVVAEMRSTVTGPGGRSSGSGSSTRAAYRLSKSKSTRASAAASAEKRSGLRQTIASGIGSSASATATNINLTFKTRSSVLPLSQRRLAKAWNRPKGWRHPVFGNKGTWVTQVGAPYFDAVIKKNADGLMDAAHLGMEAAADAILHE